LAKEMSKKVSVFVSGISIHLDMDFM